MRCTGLNAVNRGWHPLLGRDRVAAARRASGMEGDKVEQADIGGFITCDTRSVKESGLVW
jgi:hypothetical protein